MAESHPSTQTADLAGTLPGRAIRRIAAALQHRDFRVLWFGACTSSIGTWMQSLAENWLVLSLTASAFYLGLDAFLQQLPIMLFTLIGGVIADRHDRRQTLMASQWVQLASAATLALLVYSGVVHIWHILALSFLTGCAQAFGGPAYQSLIPSLVGKKDLTNAIALNSIQFNVARMIGPLLAGATLAAFKHWGVPDMTAFSACFSLNALSFLVVIVALMSLHIKHLPATHTENMMQEMRHGLSYVRKQPSIRALMVLGAATTFFAIPMMTLLPVFAKEVFGSDVEGYSKLLAFSGAGAVVGSMVVAWLGQFPRMGLTTLLVEAGLGLLLTAVAVTRSLHATYLLLFITGVALMIAVSTIMSLVQLTAPNDMRGRVMSIYLVAFRGGMPLGSLVSGFFASRTSASTVFTVNGVMMMIVSIYFLLKSKEIRAL
ncbi:MAG TPA: MFS transporter [Vicinamibacterales bacterium]|nr:MFS transporter [Vicinamibacterales bacterium]